MGCMGLGKLMYLFFWIQDDVISCLNSNFKHLICPTEINGVFLTSMNIFTDTTNTEQEVCSVKDVLLKPYSALNIEIGLDKLSDGLEYQLFTRKGMLGPKCAQLHSIFLCY